MGRRGLHNGGMTLESLQGGVDAARAGELNLAGLGRQLRSVQLPPALPARYGEVLASMADRVEASALFSGESCSFSESDLLDAVQAWLDKALAASRSSQAC